MSEQELIQEISSLEPIDCYLVSYRGESVVKGEF
jgi:hypothetical protein